RLDWRFALLAPVAAETRRYILFIDSDAPASEIDRAARVLEEHLATGHHYQHCRKLGQLAPLSWQRVRNADAIYQAAMLARGHKLGDIKPSCLDQQLLWAELFQKAALDSAR